MFDVRNNTFFLQNLTTESTKAGFRQRCNFTRVIDSPPVNEFQTLVKQSTFSLFAKRRSIVLAKNKNTRVNCGQCLLLTGKSQQRKLTCLRHKYNM